MISWAPIWAVVLRHTRLYRRDPNLLLAVFYWPLLDIFIWGFLGSWVQRSAGPQFHNYEAAALLGVLLWQIVGRGANMIAFAFQEELWSNNLLNLFSLPLRLVEWISGILLFYLIIVTATAACSIAVAWSLYSISLWDLISTFIIFCPPLFFSGIWLGFTSLIIVIFLGKRGVELGFVVVWFLLPFSGAYYPIDVLPTWAQGMTNYIPMSYVFKGMRGFLMHHQDPTAYLIKGYILNSLYAVCTVILFVYFFNRSKKKGLARLMD
jgi:ABC-2 type transport system permease protein